MKLNSDEASKQELIKVTPEKNHIINQPPFRQEFTQGEECETPKKYIQTLKTEGVILNKTTKTKT